MKICNRCGISKSRVEFYRSKREGDGLQAKCKDCSRETLREWQAKNRERTRQASRAYYWANREAVLAYKASYYEENREAILAWFRERPLRDVAKAHRRRAQTASLAVADLDYIAVLRGDPCSYCGEAAGTIDHIQPLSGGGSCGWDNLTASCRRCNGRKRTATLLRFLSRSL